MILVSNVPLFDDFRALQRICMQCSVWQRMQWALWPQGRTMSTLTTQGGKRMTEHLTSKLYCLNSTGYSVPM